MTNRRSDAPTLRRLRLVLAASLPLAGLALAQAARAQDAGPADAPLARQIAALPPALRSAAPAALALLTQAARAQLPAAARLNVEFGRLDARLQPAPCEQVQPHLLAGAPTWGRTRVGLRCLRGTVAWNIFIPVHVQVVAPALVATAPLAAGSTLSMQNVQLAMAEWTAGPGGIAAVEAPLTDAAQAEGRVLARPLAHGQALRPADLHTRQWFAAGDTVDIVAVGPGFAVAGQGQALTPGREGQPARVRTDSGRIVIGMPSGERRLELRI